MSFFDLISKMVEGFFKAAAAILIIAAIIGFPLMWLWNWLMPLIFDLPDITFWQAIGLSVLSSILFKSQRTTLPTKEKKSVDDN
jgi:hypothetical protein